MKSGGEGIKVRDVPKQIEIVLSGVWLVIRETLRSFSRNRSLATAATLAYYGSISLMPFLLIVIFILSLFLRSSDQVMTSVEQLMAQIFPVSSDSIISDLLTLSEQKVWGIVSVVVLLWAVTPFAGALREAMFTIFKAEKRLHFFKGKLLDLAAVLGILAFFIVMAVRRMFFSFLPVESLSHLEFLSSWGAVAGSGLTSAVVLALVYVVFSPVRLRLWPLLCGVATAGLLLAGIKPVFGFVLRFNPNYGYAFGSLKTIFLLIVWVYYTCAAVLLGAEVIATVRKRHALVLKRLFQATDKKKPKGNRLLSRFVREYSKGESVFGLGDTGDSMYYVLAGEVGMVRKGKELAIMREGDYFGEMSMLLEAPRTATATIRSEAADLVEISKANFETILKDNPGVVKMMLQTLAKRLEQADHLLEQYTSGVKS